MSLKNLLIGIVLKVRKISEFSEIILLAQIIVLILLPVSFNKRSPTTMDPAISRNFPQSGYVGKCREYRDMSGNVGIWIFLEISGNVGKCQEMSGNVGICWEMLGYVGKCREMSGSGYFGKYQEMSGNVRKCWDMLGNVRICREMSGYVGIMSGNVLIISGGGPQ